MTAAQRRRMVIALRCGADLCERTTTPFSEIVPMLPRSPIENLVKVADHAMQAVQVYGYYTTRALVTFDELRWTMLEAAQRIEEGSYP